MSKLAIITTHPIQYYAPVFRTLGARGKIEVKVFYTWSQAKDGQFDPDFKKKVSWDVDLLSGYEYTFVNNVSKKPGSRHYKGIDNPTLVSEIEQFEPSAILVFGWAFKSHLAVLRNFKGYVPLYFRGDSTLLDEPKNFSVKKVLRRIFLRWVYTHIDKAFYVGKNNNRYYRALGLSHEQLIRAPHAIDNHRFSNTEPGLVANDRNIWRRNRGISESALVFLFVGKFLEKKDPLSLLNAFLSLNDSKSYLVFVGNGELEDTLKQVAFGHENVFFEPFQNQSAMPGIYNAGDVFVLPSKGPGETWGLAVNEAMACGKPVVVSDKCGCAADLVKEGENGFVFNAGDVEALTRILAKFLSAGVDLNAMGAASRNIVQQYSFTAICEAIEHEMANLS